VVGRAIGGHLAPRTPQKKEEGPHPDRGLVPTTLDGSDQGSLQTLTDPEALSFRCSDSVEEATPPSAFHLCTPQASGAEIP